MGLTASDLFWIWPEQFVVSMTNWVSIFSNLKKSFFLYFLLKRSIVYQQLSALCPIISNNSKEEEVKWGGMEEGKAQSLLRFIACWSSFLPKQLLALYRHPQTIDHISSVRHAWCWSQWKNGLEFIRALLVHLTNTLGHAHCYLTERFLCRDRSANSKLSRTSSLWSYAA